MYWKYSLFETKLLLHNRKNGFLGLLLLLFFILYFIFSYSQTEQVTLLDEKRMEGNWYTSVFNQLPDPVEDTPEYEVYKNLEDQSTLVNYQRFHLTRDENEEFIELSHELKHLRLRVIELDNKGIPEHLVMEKEYILKENILLNYIEKNDLPLQQEPVTASHFLMTAFTTVSGLIFYMFLLLFGSEILTFENRHRTVMNGFPISFMKKATSKISLYFTHIISFLAGGLFIGFLYAANQTSSGNFSYPVLIYNDGGFEAVSTLQFLMYSILAIVLITVLVLTLSVLLNMLFNNAYFNVLIGLGLFMLPDLLMVMGINASWLHPLKFVDFSSVLTGDLASQLGNSQIDYWHAIFALFVMTLLLTSLIFLVNKAAYIKNRPNQHVKESA